MSVCSVSRLAIISGSVAFFAPEIGIVPFRRLAADDANTIHDHPRGPAPGNERLIASLIAAKVGSLPLDFLFGR